MENILQTGNEMYAKASKAERDSIKTQTMYDDLKISIRDGGLRDGYKRKISNALYAMSIADLSNVSDKMVKSADKEYRKLVTDLQLARDEIRKSVDPDINDWISSSYRRWFSYSKKIVLNKEDIVELAYRLRNKIVSARNS